MSLKNRLNKHSRFAEKERVDVTFLQYEMPTLPFPNASFAAAFMGNVYCYVPHRASRIAFLAEIARVLYPNGEVLMSQTVLDSVLESYEAIYDNNHHQFAPNYETLEEGDGFALGAPHYLHYFFAEDLIKELEASPFQIVHSSFEEREIYMYFKGAKHMMKIIAASGHPDVPLAILFPDTTGITGTHQSECKTRFVTCIERSRVYQQIMKKQYISSGRPQLNRLSQTEPLLRLLKI